MAYRQSAVFKNAVAAIGAQQPFIKPGCPWTNGKVERFNRTLQTEWAHRRPFTNNSERAAALAPWLDHYNHSATTQPLGDPLPISRVSPT